MSTPEAYDVVCGPGNHGNEGNSAVTRLVKAGLAVYIDPKTTREEKRRMLERIVDGVTVMGGRFVDGKTGRVLTQEESIAKVRTKFANSRKRWKDRHKLGEETNHITSSTAVPKTPVAPDRLLPGEMDLRHALSLLEGMDFPDVTARMQAAQLLLPQLHQEQAHLLEWTKTELMKEMVEYALLLGVIPRILQSQQTLDESFSFILQQARALQDLPDTPNREKIHAILHHTFGANWIPTKQEEYMNLRKIRYLATTGTMAEPGYVHQIIFHEMKNMQVMVETGGCGALQDPPKSPTKRPRPQPEPAFAETHPNDSLEKKQRQWHLPPGEDKTTHPPHQDPNIEMEMETEIKPEQCSDVPQEAMEEVKKEPIISGSDVMLAIQGGVAVTDLKPVSIEQSNVSKSEIPVPTTEAVTTGIGGDILLSNSIRQRWRPRQQNNIQHYMPRELEPIKATRAWDFVMDLQKEMKAIVAGICVVLLLLHFIR